MDTLPFTVGLDGSTAKPEVCSAGPLTLIDVNIESDLGGWFILHEDTLVAHGTWGGLGDLVQFGNGQLAPSALALLLGRAP